MMDLRVWPNVVADGHSPTTTPGKGHDGKENSTDQMWKLAKLAKKHRNGHIPKVDWLDRLTFRELEVINEREKRSSNYLRITRGNFQGIVKQFLCITRRLEVCLCFLG